MLIQHELSNVACTQYVFPWSQVGHHLHFDFDSYYNDNNSISFQILVLIQIIIVLKEKFVLP